MTLNMLTLAVIDVDDSVPIAQSLDEAADEALGALGCSVDANQVEGTFRSRHGGEIGRVINYKNATVARVSFFLFSKMTSAALATSPHCGMLPLRLIQRRARHTPLSVSIARIIFRRSATIYVLPLFILQLIQPCPKSHLPSRVRTLKLTRNSKLTTNRPGALCPQVEPRQGFNRRARRSQVGCWISSLPGQGGYSAPILRHFSPEPWSSNRCDGDHRAHSVPFGAK